MAVDSTTSDRLNSWKEIASYLDKDTRTVMRWQERGLPVHRVPGGKRQAVFAYRHEIDSWLSGAVGPVGPASTGEVPLGEPQPLNWGRVTVSPRSILVLGALILVLVGAVALWLKRTSVAIQFREVRQLTNDGFEKKGLVTDGSRVYFGDHRGGRLVLASVPASGGPLELIPSPPVNAFPVDITADGQRLLVLASGGHESEAELWTVALHGDTKRVGQLHCHSAAWTPDGKTIGCLSGRTFYLTNDAGDKVQAANTFDLIPKELQWSERSHVFRFLLCDADANSCSMWERSSTIDSGSPPRMLSSQLRDCCQQWTAPDKEGSFLATPLAESERRVVWLYGRETPGGNSGTGPIRLPMAFSVGSIAAENSGSTLFVASAVSKQADLFGFDPTTHAFRPVLPGVDARYLDFTSKDDRVVYVNSQDGSLWVSRANGDAARRLYGGVEEIELPRWSPDGAQIGFLVKRKGAPWRILLIPAGGGPAREVSSDSENQGAPTWSPDGTELAFGNVSCEETHSCAIHRVKVATGATETLPGSNGLRTARWSPDGKYIAAMDFTKHQVVVYDIAKSKWRIVAEHVNGDDLSWSSDSSYLYSNRATGEAPEIVRFPVSGVGKPETVLDLATLNKLPGNIETWFCLAPDGSIIVLRDLSNSNIFALDWSRR